MYGVRQRGPVCLFFSYIDMFILALIVEKKIFPLKKLSWNLCFKKNELTTYIQFYFYTLFSFIDLCICLCEYHTISFTVALQKVLKSSIVSIQSIFFFFKILLASLCTRNQLIKSHKKKCLLQFQFILQMNQQINLARIKILIILNLPFHEHGIYFSIF